MISQKVKLSPHGNFQVTKLLETVAICEAQEDRYNWGNATRRQTSFYCLFGMPKRSSSRKD